MKFKEFRLLSEAQKEHFEIGAKDSDEIVSTTAQSKLDNLK